VHFGMGFAVLCAVSFVNQSKNISGLVLIFLSLNCTLKLEDRCCDYRFLVSAQQFKQLSSCSRLDRIFSAVMKGPVDLIVKIHSMVMLAKSIALDPEIPNPKVVLVNDRVDLDDQMYGTFPQ